MFFDEHERFLDTGTVFTARHRLNLRHKAIFERNRDVLQGARVLDIASHDGRWSFAALQAGASHVVGVEARGDVVESARESLAAEGVDKSSYEFVEGDIFDVMAENKYDVDVVMCLGFLYHTYRHTELFSLMRACNPSHLLLDTTVAPDNEAILRLRRDNPDNAGQAVLDKYAYGTYSLVARPSAPAVRMMIRAYGFEVEDEVDWPQLIKEHRHLSEGPKQARVGDYRKGTRITLRARSKV
ncbi:MAG TPA: methyltransferase domain-containing protein [Nocardioidaceae bacterium]|nr:methyltransferase domain-containing protein [Nocardioidaceae bacterium]